MSKSKRVMARNKHFVDVWTQQQIDNVKNCFDMVNLFYKDRKSFGNQWPDWCGLPMAATYAILTNGALNAAEVLQAQGDVNRLSELTAALIWVRSKTVYRFDQTLLDVLLVQPMDDAIPFDVLKHLPQHCVFIEAPVIKDSKGFFAWLECDAHTLVPELRILFLLEDNTTVSFTKRLDRLYALPSRIW